MRVYIAFAAMLTVTGMALTSLADSLPIENGRYSGGEVLVLSLNESQTRSIQQHYEPYMELTLDSAQQASISQVTSVQPPPSKLIVVHPADTAGECTCGLTNFGLIFHPGRIELPLKYIMTDEEAEARKIID